MAQFVSASVTDSSVQTAFVRIRTPAEAIMATTAGRGCQRTGYARKPCPDKRGRVDRNRAGGHFRDGDKIGELLQTEPAVLRDDHIPAAECKRAEIQRGKKQLFQHLFSALHPIRLQSYAAMRRAALTLVPQEAGTVNAGFGLCLRCAKNVPCHAYGRGRRGMPGYSRIFASSSIVSSNTRSALRTVSGFVRSTPAILSSSSG